MKQYQTDSQQSRSTIGIPGLPPPQGLYHPAFEHDACGVGFSGQHQGQGLQQDRPAGAGDAREHEPSRRLRLRNRFRRRRGHDGRTPDKFFRREAMKWGFKLPKAGEYGVGDVLSAARPGGAGRNANGFSRTPSAATAWSCSAGAMCRSTTISSARRLALTEPKIRQCFIGMGETFYNRKDFNRRMYLVRQRGKTRSSSATSRRSARTSFTSISSRPTAWSTRGC